MAGLDVRNVFLVGSADVVVVAVAGSHAVAGMAIVADVVDAQDGVVCRNLDVVAADEHSACPVATRGRVPAF